MTKALAVEAAGGLAAVVTDSAAGDEGMVEMIQDETGRSVAIPALYLPGNHGSPPSPPLPLPFSAKTRAGDSRKIFQSHFKYSGEPVLIDIPLNLTLVPLDKVRKPPWDLW